MIKIDPFLLIIFAEVVVALVVILGVVTAIFIKRKNKDKQVLKALETRLKGDSSERQAVLEESIAISCGDDEDNEEAAAENKEIAKKLAEKEKAFYNNLVTMYTQRDSTALKSLDKLLHEYTSSHLESVSQMRERVDAESANISEELGQQMERLEQNGQTLASEVEKLKSENKNLSGELEKAHAEIDMAMQEYTRMAVSGSAGSKPTAAEKEPEPIKAPVEPVLEKENKTDSDADVDNLAAELEAGLGALDEAESVDVTEPESELLAELDDELDNEDTDVLVDMSMLDDFGEESEGDESAEGVTEEVVPTEVEIPGEVVEAVKPEAVDIPEEEVEEVEPEAVDVPEEVVEEVEPEAVDVPEEVVEEVEPESVEIPGEVVEEVEAEAVEITDEVIEEIEPEAVDAPAEVADEVADEVAPEEESLEDLVLHAMAEESAAQQAEAEAAVDEESPAMVIDLAKDDDIVLSDPNEASDDLDKLLEQAAEAKSVDDSGIDEDDLLAQLAEIENNDDFGSLDGFDGLPGSDEDEDKKPAG